MNKNIIPIGAITLLNVCGYTIINQCVPGNPKKCECITIFWRSRLAASYSGTAVMSRNKSKEHKNNIQMGIGISPNG